MKNLYESILKSTSTGKDAIYQYGKHIVEDDIPCTVVYNDDKCVILLSDTYAGTNNGKPTYIQDCDVKVSNYGQLYFSQMPSINDMKLNHRWDFPTTSIFNKVDNRKLMMNLYELLKEDVFRVCRCFWMIDDFGTRNKKLFYYVNDFERKLPDNSGAGVRVMKYIRLS